MPHYKDTLNNLHFLPDGVDPSTIPRFPQDAVIVSDEEAEALRIASIPAPTEEGIRVERNNLIALSDWSMLPDAPLTVEQVDAWVAYRQALRDVPQQAGFPADVTWPVAP